jgi:hypothetical protein
VLAGLPRNQFYNPGSIVKLNVNTQHPYARGMLEETPAYFISSSAFEILNSPPVLGGVAPASGDGVVPPAGGTQDSPPVLEGVAGFNSPPGLRRGADASSAGWSGDGVVQPNITTIARYAEKDALMSGWMLGEKYLNGKTALAEITYGKGKIVLFAFRPQHRGQTFATFPFIFNALEKN